MPATPEGKVKLKVDKLLKSYGSRVWFCKPVSGGYGGHGIPDYLICVNGSFIGVETKAGKNMPTALQRIQLNAIREANGRALVIREDDIPMLKDVLDRLVGD